MKFLFNVQTSFEVVADSEEKAYELVNDYPYNNRLVGDESIEMYDRDVMLVHSEEAKKGLSDEED